LECPLSAFFFSTTSSRNIEGASPRLECQIDREAQRRGKAGMAVSSYAELTKLCRCVDLGIHSDTIDLPDIR
jgi:hypothetical protein